MKKYLAAGLLSVLAATGYAEPAVLRDSVLTISATAVIEADRVQYFKNVRMRVAANGELQLIDAEPRTLAVIDELSVTVLELEPVQVQLEVNGILTDPCVALEPVSVSRDGYKFHVVIAETPPDPAALCLAQQVPYNVTVPINVTGLPSGNYLINVNYEWIDFDLD